MFSKLSGLTLALSGLLIMGSDVLAADDTSKLCAKAEQRYVELYGQPSAKVSDAVVVKMYKYRFCPEKVSVRAGTTVRWVNVDKRTSHTVHLNETNEPESLRLFPKETFEFTFLSAGEQKYLCGPHWETQKMIGMVSVTP
ncbi:cupredoxin domain-containing protein [Flexibacterium corallicola]|uniref:cupredoxin domain-containing protein n=1 Tax=Flexibacterium corallicola TaxID=3037259 RepID=UPI00286F335C|nr:plastocyanin/azurin family copper-binding protein [Pseudovibrio sp. M1P-2-3]